jgi:hypothetical protein
MNVVGSRQVVPPDAGAWWRCEAVSLPNLIRALIAILFWSLVLGPLSVCYELWRLEHNWRLGIA